MFVTRLQDSNTLCCSVQIPAAVEMGKTAMVFVTAKIAWSLRRTLVSSKSNLVFSVPFVSDQLTADVGA